MRPPKMTAQQVFKDAWHKRQAFPVPADNPYKLREAVGILQGMLECAYQVLEVEKKSKAEQRRMSGNPISSGGVGLMVYERRRWVRNALGKEVAWTLGYDAVPAVEAISPPLAKRYNATVATTLTACDAARWEWSFDTLTHKLINILEHAVAEGAKVLRVAEGLT